MTLIDDQIREILDGMEPLTPEPPGRPRWTAPWQRSGVQVITELRGLAQDPEVGAAFNGCGILASAGDPLLADALSALLSMASEKAPTALFCLGQVGLSDWMLSQLMAMTHLRVGEVAQALAVLNAMSERLRFGHFQDNPGLLNADGTATTAPGMTRQQYLELSDFERSQGPERKPGRPRKSPKPKGPARPRISDAAIQDTKTMRLPEWAGKHAPDLDLADKRQSKAAGARYDRAAVHRRRREP